MNSIAIKFIPTEQQYIDSGVSCLLNEVGHFWTGNMPTPWDDYPPKDTMDTEEVCAVSTIEQFLQWFPLKVWDHIKNKGKVIIYNVPDHAQFRQRKQTIIRRNYAITLKEIQLTNLQTLRKEIDEASPESNHI